MSKLPKFVAFTLPTFKSPPPPPATAFVNNPLYSSFLFPPLKSTRLTRLLLPTARSSPPTLSALTPPPRLTTPSLGGLTVAIKLYPARAILSYLTSTKNPSSTVFTFVGT